jgi:uroporphyrinogen III methyltransferase/synthase
MGVANLEQIATELVQWGKPSQTPVALIRWGTWMEQETITGTLADIVEKVKAANFQSPAVTIVGEVVSLREKLAWFEKKPLFGKRVLVTRARSQASELTAMIDELGGEAIEFPVIQLVAPTSEQAQQQRDDALRRLAEFDWVFFTSVNGVQFFYDRLRELRVDIRTMCKARIAAVGPKTAEALLERGIVAEPLPSKFQAEGLLDSVQSELKAGQRVLLPTADIARDVLPKKLKELGLEVTEIDIYENSLSVEGGDDVLELLRSRAITTVTFTSSSTVRNLFAALREVGEQNPKALLSGCEIACIGPLTADTVKEAGLSITHMAEEATVKSLVQALIPQKSQVNNNELSNR